MMKIEEVNKHFRTAAVGNQQFCFFDVNDPPFVLEGFPWRDKADHGRFFRLPERTKKQINSTLVSLSGHTSGGAVRFRSNSAGIAIRAELIESRDMNHMPRAGSAGFDIYMGRGKQAIHIGTAQPNANQKILEVVISSYDPRKIADYQINFPLYGGVQKLEVGVLPGAVLEAPKPHRIAKPILFYGSSITQGACASRPGNTYCAMLCRALDAEQVNLGFSGCNQGEPPIAELIAELDLAAFVLDYDHNAPNVEHLRATHEPFFRIVRAKHPDLPILMLSKCDIWPNVKDQELAEELQRREVIRETWKHATDAGDTNVYFINGEKLFGKRNRNDCTVDRSHPSDLGFYRISSYLLRIMKKILAC